MGASNAMPYTRLRKVSTQVRVRVHSSQLPSVFKFSANLAVELFKVSIEVDVLSEVMAWPQHRTKQNSAYLARVRMQASKGVGVFL